MVTAATVARNLYASSKAKVSRTARRRPRFVSGALMDAREIGDAR
jgi:hypothetical protein